MNEKKRLLRNRLIETEHMREDRKKSYEKELKMIFEQKITTPRKCGFMLLIILMVTQFVYFTYAAIALKGHSFLARSGFALGMIFSLFFAVLLIRALKKGSFNLKSDANTMMNAVWIFMVFFVVIMLFIADDMDDKVAAVRMIVQTTIFFLMAITFLIKNAIDQSELKTREKLLEIDYRLAEINEKLDSLNTENTSTNT